MLLATLAIVIGFVLLVWSADRFVDGAAATALHAGMSPLLVGMVIVGFGTSAPEMVVSGVAALDGNPDLALGNAIGSNIVNTGLIVGVTALVVPIVVHSKIVRKELPLLLGLCGLLAVLMWDGELSRADGFLLLAGFFALIGWQIFSSLRNKGDALEQNFEQELKEHKMSLSAALMWLAIGLTLLIVSSRVLVWGAVEIAVAFGVSDLIIGLTIVALGTSLPELAASVAAVRKNEHEIAIGNVVGSNMFNLLAVVGIATSIHPIAQVPAEALHRDWIAMTLFIIALFFMAFGWKGQGRINRYEAAVLVAGFSLYNFYLIRDVLQGTA